jgi:hypothetical protein
MTEFIQRHQPTSDELPPWTGIKFILDVDSDKLSADLLRAYPKCGTLRERKHKAVIDFLVWELGRMRLKDSSPLADIASPQAAISETVGTHSKVCIEISPDPQLASTRTSPSVSESMPSTIIVDQSGTMEKPGTGKVSSPATNPQQFVWNARSGQSLQPKTKRKMTTEERNIYREVRRKGACSTCKKQKGKVLSS